MGPLGSRRDDAKLKGQQMLFAADYPFLNILWSMIIFFAWVIWIWIAITVLIDAFRRHDIGGWVKALAVFLIVLPFLGGSSI